MPTVYPPTTPADESDESPDGFENRFTFEESLGPAGTSGDGQPSSTDAPPEPPSLDLQTMDLSQAEAPSKPTDKRNALALMQALGAAGTAFGAASDSGLLTSVGAGLAQGGRQGVQQVDQQFARKQKAYEEFLREGRKFNLNQRNQERQARYDQQLARYESQLAGRRQEQAREEEFQNQMELIERRDELDEPSDLEQQLTRAEGNTEQAQAKKYQRQGKAAMERARRTGGRDEEDLPTDPQQLRQMREQLQAEVSSYERYMREKERTTPMGELENRTLMRQLSTQVADRLATISSIERRLQQMEGQNSQGARQGGQGGQGVPEQDLMQNRDTVFNEGGAAAPGQGRQRPTAPADTAASGQSGASTPRDLSGDVAPELRRRVMQEIPEGDSMTIEGQRYPTRQVALNAIPLVESDTTSFDAQRFRDKFGFNPFQ